MKHDNLTRTTFIPLQPEMLGQRLDKALSFVTEISSRARAQHLITEGLVTVDGKLGKSSQKILGTEKILVAFPEPASTTLQALDIALDILFEDEDIVVLNKPSGLVVHPAAGHAQDTLVNALLHHVDNFSMKFGDSRPGIVHRLDRDTSGVLVVAKNDLAHEKLSLQFKARSTHRIYHALCWNRPPLVAGTIQSYLARHPRDRKKFASVKTTEDADTVHGKWAITHYKVLKTIKVQTVQISYLQIKLETGRTHQIRVHLSEANCPLLADPLYGYKRKEDLFPRLALHASELGFIHPRSNQKMFFKVDWPQDILQILKNWEIL